MGDLEQAREQALAAYDGGVRSTYLERVDAPLMQRAVVEPWERSAAAPPRDVEPLGRAVSLCACFDDALGAPSWLLQDGRAARPGRAPRAGRT